MLHLDTIQWVSLCFAEPLPPSVCAMLKRSVAEKWTLYTLQAGLGSLPQALHQYLLERDVQVHLESPCSKLHFKGDKIVVCMCSSVWLVNVRKY